MQETQGLEITTFLGDYNREITYIYGTAGSGKTTLAMLASVELVKKGKKVIFIDTENGVSIERLNQLYNSESLLENLFLIKITDFDDQCKKIENLMNLYKMFDLIVVDTIGSIYRDELKKDSIGTNIKITRQLKTLLSISKEVPVILTNQVYTKIPENVITPVGGELIKKFCNKIIELQREPRKIKLIKPEEKEILFEINETGIKLKSF